MAQFISHHDDGKLLATWAFACRYRLDTVLKSVEAEIRTFPLKITGELDEALRYVSSLPSSSTDLGLRSLMSLLHSTTKSWEDLSTTLHDKCDEVKQKWERKR